MNQRCTSTYLKNRLVVSTNYVVARLFADEKARYNIDLETVKVPVNLEKILSNLASVESLSRKGTQILQLVLNVQAGPLKVPSENLGLESNLAEGRLRVSKGFSELKKISSILSQDVSVVGCSVGSIHVT